MRYVRYQGETSIADLAKRVVDFEGRPDTKLLDTVSSALLRSNPQLNQIERLSADAIIVVPDLPGVKLTQESQPFGGGVGVELGKAIREGMAAAQARLESNHRREVDEARGTLDLLASSELLELAESEPDVKQRLPHLQEAANGRLKQMETGRKHQQLAFKLLHESADRLLGAAAEQVKLSSLTIDATELAGDTSTTATVRLNAPAPQGGAFVVIRSDHQELLKIPAEVTVPAGEVSSTFTLSSSRAPVAEDTPVAIKAEYGGESRSANLLIESLAQVQAVGLATISLAEKSVVGGASVQGKLTLTVPAHGKTAVVNLSVAGTAGKAVALPESSVTFAEGESEREFVIDTSRVAKARHAVIKAELGDEEKTVELLVQPPTEAIQLESLTLEKESIRGGESVTARVTLSAVVPQSVQVGLMATVVPILGALKVTVPEYVVVRGKQKSATFKLQSGSVRRNLLVKIAANYGGVVREATLAVKRQ